MIPATPNEKAINMVSCFPYGTAWHLDIPCISTTCRGLIFMGDGTGIIKRVIIVTDMMGIP